MTEERKLSSGRIVAYTDGGCKPNPGPGGWGAVVRFGDREWLLSGNAPWATNNQMEIQAAVAALGLLESLAGPSHVDMYTDSEYLRQGITSWIEGWKANGWKTTSGEPVKNRGLWEKLGQLTLSHQVSWHWLKGHAGHIHNERADQLASQARASLASRSPVTRTPIDALTRVEISVKSSFNPTEKQGAWGLVLRQKEHTRNMSRQEANLSTNALLIRGAIEGLLALTRPCHVIVYSDADYLIRGASQWIKGWQTRGWLTKDGKPVANQEEWQRLLDAARSHQVFWQIRQADEWSDLATAAELAALAAAGGTADEEE